MYPDPIDHTFLRLKEKFPSELIFTEETRLQKSTSLSPAMTTAAWSSDHGDRLSSAACWHELWSMIIVILTLEYATLERNIYLLLYAIIILLILRICPSPSLIHITVYKI